MYWPSGFAQVIHRFEQEGDSEQMLTTIGVSSTGLPSNGVLIANLFMDAFVAELDTIFSVDITLVGVTVIAGPSSAPITHDSSSAPVAGLASQGIVLPNTSLLVRKQTETGGRAGRGRMYWPGFGNVNELSGNGLLESDYVGTLDTAFEDWRQYLLAATGDAALGDLYLFHSTESAPSAITGLAVQQRLATQRRRLRP